MYVLSEQEFLNYIRRYRNNATSTKVSKNIPSSNKYTTTMRLNVDVSQLMTDQKKYLENINKTLSSIHNKNTEDILKYEKINHKLSKRISDLESKIESLHNKKYVK